MSILGEFLPLERSAKQVSLLAGLLTLQRPGRLERTGGISVFCICNQVWTAPPSLPEPQVRDNRLAPQVPTVKVIYSTASLYLRPAEWPSTHHELGGQPPAASETSSALDGGPLSSATADNQPCAPAEENRLAEDSLLSPPGNLPQPCSPANVRGQQH